MSNRNCFASKWLDWIAQSVATLKGHSHYVCARVVYIGSGRILKVEGHSGGCNYFGAKRR